MATVLVPWRGGDPHREDAWRWVRERWTGLPYGLKVCEAPPGPWSKGGAFMPHVAGSEDVVVIADADCWCEGVNAAVAAVEGGADWAAPHTEVRRLTEMATEYLLAGCQVPLSLAIEECPINGGAYNGFLGGGIVVVRRDVLLDVPFDPRFVGWGGEDASWRDAMLTLVGPPWRGRDPLFHLWHPPQPRLSRKVGSRETAALRSRYVQANRSRRKMRALLDEIPPFTDRERSSA